MTLKQFTREYERLINTNQKQCKQFVDKVYHSIQEEPSSYRLSVLYRKAYLNYLNGEIMKTSRELEEVIVEGTMFPFFSEYTYAFNLLGVINMIRKNPI